jgi:ATP-dependent protease HslVU (ClpYQ) peptidase subunit
LTTIVYRDGVLAGDSRAYSGDKHPIGSKLKIRRLTDGTLLGASSTIPGAGEKVLDWYAGGQKEDFDLPDHFTLLVAKPNGEVFYANDSAIFSGPLTSDFFSIGSGEQYAHGALLMGASAVEAVRAACFADAWTDFPIYAASHKRKTLWSIES